ncbi:MAG: serine/threonine-protein phosphatase [Spirochaetales bacterium]|nr:serine/threonine-protein phosphatase [Spirochaetales bacterium]
MVNEKGRTVKLDLEIARKIQFSMMPKEFPFQDFLEASGFCLPMAELGGDYYDIFKISEQEAGILMVDVCGHGVAAALITAVAKISFRNHAKSGLSASDIMNRVNSDIYRTLGEFKIHLTAVFCVLDLNNNTLEYCNAGHSEVLVLSADGETRTLEANSFFVGVMEDVQFHSSTIDLNPGDRLVLYTKGIPEARNPDEGIYSFSHFMDFLQKHRSQPVAKLTRLMIDDLNTFCKSHEKKDDQTFLAIDFMGNPYPQLIFDLNLMEKIQKHRIDLTSKDDEKFLYFEEEVLKAIHVLQDANCSEAIEILSTLEQDANRNEDKYKIWSLLGYAHYLNKNYLLSLKIWKQAAKLFPFNDTINSNLQILEKINRKIHREIFLR